MGQALYRKYRSKSLDELVGQEHITTTLAEAIKQGRISHAYLFTGPRGVGKTSTARILAHAINNLQYSDEATHLDIIEIDAASNNSVEDVRDLREKVYVAPSVGKYKVYIIDEVHMLSKAAFNAILKTLEEPPAHAVFILATTEAHKLPETIVSRTQRFVFRPISTEKAVQHLRNIAETEHIAISDSALELLAAHGDGSFRDSISLLDQASTIGKKIEDSDIQALLGIPTSEAITALLQSVTAAPIQVAESLKTLYSLYDQGFQAASIAHELSAQLRQQIVDGNLPPSTHIIDLMSKLLDVSTRRDPERYLEIILLSLGGAGQHASTPKITSVESAESNLSPRSQPTVVKTLASPSSKGQTKSQPKIDEQQATKAKLDGKPKQADAPVDAALWAKVLDELKKEYNTLYGIVRMASVQFTGPDELELRFAFAFHQKRVNEAKNREIISKCVGSVSGQKVTIHCLFDPELKSTKPKVAELPPVPSSSKDPESLAAISNIFGGGELLQS